MHIILEVLKGKYLSFLVNHCKFDNMLICFSRCVAYLEGHLCRTGAQSGLTHQLGKLETTNNWSIWDKMSRD